MPDMLAILQSNTVLAGLLPSAPQRVAPIALPGTAPAIGDFGTALSGLLVPGLAGKAKGNRQPDAEGGKDLPETVKATSAADPMIAWLPEGLAPILLPADFPLPEGTPQPVTASPVEPRLMPGMPASVDPLASVAASSVPDEAAPVVTGATLPAQPSAALPDTSQAIEQVAPRASQPAEPQVDALVTPQSDTPAESPVIGRAAPQAEPQVPQQGSPQTALHVTPSIAPQPVLQLPPEMTARIAPEAMSAGSPDAASRMQPQPIVQTAPQAAAPIVTQAQTAAQPATIVEVPTPNANSKPENVELVAAARSRFDSPERDAAWALPPARVPLPPAPTLTMQPVVAAGAAAQVFAAALAAPATPDAGPADRIGEAAILLGGLARTEQLTTVQAMSGASQALLDLTRDDWAGAMIDRITALRDAAEAADTRIKLAPENLGALEVSIRRDGDRVHVHIAAENPAARQIIADAAPRLGELAEARGVKLGQTSVDGGGEQGARREPQQQPAHPAARNSLAMPMPDVGADQRIA